MRRPLRAALLLAIELVAVLVLAPEPAARASPWAAYLPREVAGAWAAGAKAAILDFMALDNGRRSAFQYAYVADAIAQLSSWSNPAALHYLNVVRGLRHPDGGYGLPTPHDVFSDGSVDPVSTAYTISMADHVGPVMLDAYRHDAATAAEVRSIATYLVTKIPRLAGADGICLAYTNAPVDDKPGYCVHNANAAVALFLSHVLAAGIHVDGAAALIAGIDQQERAAYLPAVRNWRYTTGRPGLSDIDHESLNVAWALSQAPSIGVPLLHHIETTAFPGDRNAALGHLRLGAFDCADAGRWLGQFDAWLRHPPDHPSIRYAQLARWAARNAAACG